ncbi:uncharacterized protein LOC122938680 [Bufo gargarizans]|uniref:uncharacterized protein LOC122938680 n=1 Tax=Bufo gargarizans TaxID=30331 RepID=UPI001CF2DC2F|nr:uncharacterized protein LOC122938680 [Bufo gargarizans]
MVLENDRNTKKWQFRNEDPEKPNKVIMMIGEVGSGKTTLINAFINYIFGVQWKYDCRIQLIGEETVRTQDPHQKSTVMVYQINHQTEFCIPHSLTIIDTPGLPETQGVTPQRTAVQKIRELFYNSELNHIDVICFVTQPSMTSLSLTQKFVFDSLLAMFGPKVHENIVTFMTCAEDDQKPPALATMIHAKVPCAKNKNGHPIHFKFKNGVLYVNNSPDDNDASVANEQHWNSGMEDINNFFKYLSGTSRKNIALQRNILMLSNASEITVDALVHRIEEMMSKQYELEQTEKILKRHKVEIEKDEYFEFEVSKSIKEKIDTKENCTNCHECNSTCHQNCLVAYDSFVYLCEVFYFNASCRVCGHGSSRHFSEKFLWKNLVFNNKVTYRSIKMKYKRDDQEVLTYQMVLERMKAEMEQLGEQGSQLILRATDQIKQFTVHKVFRGIC